MNEVDICLDCGTPLQRALFFAMATGAPLDYCPKCEVADDLVAEDLVVVQDVRDEDRWTPEPLPAEDQAFVNAELKRHPRPIAAGDQADKARLRQLKDELRADGLELGGH